jgi:hypothetical protein
VSSGMTYRHRLNRSGDRQATRACNPAIVGDYASTRTQAGRWLCLFEV